MDLIQFKKDIEKELELSILGNEETPILNRLQIHLNNLNQEYNLSTMLNPQNIQHELYLSMVHQIVYPAKPTYQRKVMLNNKEVEGNNMREKMFKIVQFLGVDKIKQLPINSKNLYQSEIEDPVRFRSLEDDFVFDITFKGVGASQGGENFIKEINKVFPEISLELITESEYKY